VITTILAHAFIALPTYGQQMAASAENSRSIVIPEGERFRGSIGFLNVALRWRNRNLIRA
jgi:hypothetical protein